MHLAACAIVEIFPPKNGTAGDRGDVQRSRAARDDVSHSEFGFVRAARDDRCGNRGDESARRQHGKRVEAVAKQARGQAVDGGEATTPSRPEFCHGLPGDTLGIPNLGA